jgi:EpsI family protein
MSRAHTTGVLVCVATLMIAGMVYFGRLMIYTTDILGKPGLETLLPSLFADWYVDDRSALIASSPDNQTLAHTYDNNSGDKVMLSLVYGGDQLDGMRAYLPERCYLAQDFKVSSNTREIVTLTGCEVVTSQLMSQRDARMEPITYWFLVGDQVTVSRTKQKLAQFRLGFKDIILNGMLVGLSDINSGINRNHKLQQVSLSEMTLAIPEGDRNRVLGATSGVRLL